MKNPNLLDINPRAFDDKVMTPGEIEGWFDCAEAILRRRPDENPQKPHVELVSGLCSDGFVNCGEIFSYPNLKEILALQLVRKLKEAGLGHVDWVVGSAYGSITISDKVAEILKARHGFPEKDPLDASGKRLIWRRLDIPPKAKVLRVEELITTWWTVRELTRAIREGNPSSVSFLPIIGAIVYRPSQSSFDFREITKLVYLLEMEFWTAYKENCPLCKAGSPRLRPKGHWRELTGRA